MKPAKEDLATFLRRQSVDDLACVLLELAGTNEAVQARLDRMQLADRPDELAAGFRKTLAGWKRSSKIISYREASEFGRMLDSWLDKVAGELLPRDPPAALALFESFIESDAAWFERADDSDGMIGDAVRSACDHWLKAAALCELPRAIWPDRILTLYLADEYGARDTLLRHAHLLLDEPEQRALVSQLEARLDAQTAKPDLAGTGAGAAVRDDYRLTGALSLLSESLRDPDVMVRATLRHSPQPNGLQRRQFVRAYLDADRPADAMVWLTEPWGHHDGSREDMLAEVLERLGRFDESSPIRQRAFEQSLSVFDLERWTAHLPETARPDAIDRARQLARGHADPARAAALLLHLDDPVEAEARLLADPALIDGRDYGHLVPLAKALRTHDCPRGETVVYRALMRGILDRAYARAYGHAARYWARLGEIAAAGVSLAPLASHEAFSAEIRQRHGRKPAFWAFVNGTRRDRHDESDDVDE